MKGISKFVALLLSLLMFAGCGDILKLAKIAYEECLGPADEGDEIFVPYKFDQNFFVMPGKLTMKTRAQTIDMNEDLPQALRFSFVYKDKSTTLFQFAQDLDFDSNGRLPTLTLNFNDPGVLFRKGQTIRLAFVVLFGALALSEFRYNFKYTADLERATGILPVKPVRPRAPMSVSVGEYEDF